MVICLQRGADCLHMVQLIPLHPKTPSSLASFKSRLVLPCYYRLIQVALEKRLLNRCSSSCCCMCMLLTHSCFVLHTHTLTHLTALFPGLPRWAGTRKVKPIWILLKQETVSGSGISWAICKSAPCSRQTTTPVCFYRPDALPAAQPTVSKHCFVLQFSMK